MKYITTLVLSSLLVLSFGAMAEHHEEKDMMADMKSEAQMKKAEMHEKMAVQHRALGECLKTYKDDHAKCETQKAALKESRMAMKEHHQDMKGKMKEMRHEMHDKKKKAQKSE